MPLSRHTARAFPARLNRGEGIAAIQSTCAGWRRHHPARWLTAASSCSLQENSSEVQKLARLEAVLFLAREPLTSRRLASLANLADGTEARTLVRTLQQRYDQWNRPFQVERIAGGFQLLTRPSLAASLNKNALPDDELRLSGPAMEVLSIVAYRQPVMRAEVEAIRGVACDEMLRQLLERNLLRITGRSGALGRPLLYGTTRHFLELFGLGSLDDLPGARQLARDSMVFDALADVAEHVDRGTADQ